MLSIKGLDPSCPAAVRNKLSSFFQHIIRPEDIFLYPNLTLGEHDLVAYIRMPCEGALFDALDHCRNLGLRGSRASLDRLTWIQADDQSGDAEVLEQMHPSGRPLVTSPPMIPSPVLRHVPTQVLERSLRMPRSRPTSARTPRTRPQSASPISPWASSPPPATRRSEVPVMSPGQASASSPLRDAPSQRVKSPYQRGPTFAAPHRPQSARTGPAHDTATLGHGGASMRASHTLHGSPTLKSPVFLERPCPRPLGPGHGLVGGDARGDPAGEAAGGGASDGRGVGCVSKTRRRGPSGDFIDVLARSQTVAETYVERSRAAWEQALFNAPWHAA